MKRAGDNKWREGLKRIEPGKWAVRITWMDAAGKRHDTERVVFADTRNDAKAQRLALTKQLANPSITMTVAEATESLVATLRSGTLASWRSHANKVVTAFGDRKLDDVKPAEVRRFLHSLPVSDATARSVRTMMVRVWERARTIGGFDGPNPVSETKPRETPRSGAEQLAALESPPVRAFQAEEVGRFLAAVPPELRALLTVQLLLGCRFGEASALQWGDVDMVARTVRITRTQYLGEVGPTKSKRARQASLGPGGVAVLRTQRTMMEVAQWPGWETWCFPRPPHPRATSPLWSYRIVADAVRSAKKAIGSSVVSTTHALRHTFATVAESQRLLRADTETVRAMLGHASADQTAAYIEPRHLPADPMAVSIELALVGASVGDAGENTQKEGE